MSFVRMKPYIMIFCCFCIQLVSIGWFEGASLPLVGMGYGAHMLFLPEITWLFHGFSLFFVMLSASAQGLAISSNLLLWLMIMVLIVRYQHILARNFIIYTALVVLMTLVAVGVQGVFSWTMWNILAILVLASCMVKTCPPSLQTTT